MDDTVVIIFLCMQDRIEELQAGLTRVADEKGQLEAQISQLANQLQVTIGLPSLAA